MTLYEYDIICARMGAYCERVYRQENLDGEICPKVSACDVQTLEGYELELMKGYGEDFEGIKQQLLELKTNPNRIELVNRYRQKFVVYDMIQALIDDIKGKKVYCPQKAQKRIIGSLERLYQMFFSVSQMCFAEFDKIKNKGINENTPPSITELLARKLEAMEYFLNLLSEGEKQHLDKNCRWKERGNQAFLASIIRKIEVSFPGAGRRDIASFLGITENQVRGSKNNYKA